MGFSVSILKVDVQFEKESFRDKFLWNLAEPLVEFFKKCGLLCNSLLLFIHFWLCFQSSAEKFAWNIVVDRQLRLEFVDLISEAILKQVNYHLLVLNVTK